jgi:hypothetical protein
MFVIYFLAFGSMGYITFGPEVKEFRSIEVLTPPPIAL